MTKGVPGLYIAAITILILKPFIMKSTTLLFFLACLCMYDAKSQNADNIYFNALSADYDYRAASFEIDTARPAYAITRGLLLWAANTGQVVNGQKISLDETNDFGVPFTQRANLQLGIKNEYLEPKRIIKSIYGKFYYLLAHVVNSPNPINNVTVRSTAYVLKLDDNLNLIWSSKIHHSTINTSTAQAMIEYNDVFETSDQNIVLVGRYARDVNAQQAVQITKLNQANGANIWWFWYYLWNCNANAISVEEASNGDLVATGYAEECTAPLVAGYRQLLFARVNAVGVPVLFRKFAHNPGYDVSGDQVTRFVSSFGGGADRFFITGYVVTDNGVPNADMLNKQNLVVDISQNGLLNRAAHWGDAGDEEVNDHIFTQRSADSLVLNLTGYTTSYDQQSRAYYCTLGYNKVTLAFTLFRYDVIRNTYPSGRTYISRTGNEIKFAGSRLFALLLNSQIINDDGSVQTVTNVFLRNFAPPDDNICQQPKFPPLRKISFSQKDFAPSRRVPPYRIYKELWAAYSPINMKLDCGDKWQVFPRQATGRKRQYEGPGDIVPPPYFPVDTFPPPPDLKVIAGAPVNELSKNSGLLYPNPAGDELNIMMSSRFGASTAPITVRIYSTEMKLIRTQKLNSMPVQSISLYGMAPGLYLLQVQQGGSGQTYRFVKK